MRFCLVSTQECYGGGEVLLTSIADELQKAGHSVGWIARAESQVMSRLADQGSLPLHCLKQRGRNLQDLLAVRRIIKNWSPDILIMNDTHAVVLAGLASAFLGRRRPVRLAYKHTVFPLRSRLKYQLLTDRVICVSKAARERLIRGGMADQHAIVVYGGTTPPTISPDARSRIRSQMGMREDQFLLISVGNLLPCKGHRDLLCALQLLDPQIPLVLGIAGEGAERESLELQVQKLGLQGRVRLLGYREDADQLLQAADLVIHPSHAEGLSLVLIQAQMLMKPIVATAVGGAAEVLGADEHQLYCPQPLLSSTVSCSDKSSGLACGPELIDEGPQLATELSGKQLPSATWVAKPHDPHDLAAQIQRALEKLRDPAAAPAMRLQLEKTAQLAQHRFSLQSNTAQLADVAASLIAAADQQRRPRMRWQQPEAYRGSDPFPRVASATCGMATKE
jgi:L-malate glycosyltransferase